MYAFRKKNQKKKTQASLNKSFADLDLVGEYIFYYKFSQ